MAGLIKAALVAKHGYIPATLHLKTPTRTSPSTDLKIDISADGTAVPRLRATRGRGQLVRLRRHQRPRRARRAAHPGSGSPSRSIPGAQPPCCRSRRAARRLWWRRPVGWPPTWTSTLTSHCRIWRYTLGQRRAHLNHRHAVIADSIGEAREQLQALADGGQISTGRTAPTAPSSHSCVPAWARSGGRCAGACLDAFPAFTDSILRSDRELSRHADWSLIDELRRDEILFSHGRDGDRATGQLRHPGRAGRAARAVRDQPRRRDRPQRRRSGRSPPRRPAHLRAGRRGDLPPKPAAAAHERAGPDARRRSRRRIADGDDHGRPARRVRTAGVGGSDQQPVGGDRRRRQPTSSTTIARQLDEAGIFHRYLAGKVPYHTHYMEAVQGRPPRRLRGDVVECGHASAVFDRHRRTAGQLRGRRRLLVAEHPRHRALRTGDPPNARRRLHPLRRAGSTSRAGRVDLRNRGAAASFGDGDPAT